MLAGKKPVIVLIIGLFLFSSIVVGSYVFLFHKGENGVNIEVIESTEIEGKKIEIEVKDEFTDIQSINDIAKSDDTNIKNSEEQSSKKKNDTQEKKSENVDNNSKKSSNNSNESTQDNKKATIVEKVLPKEEKKVENSQKVEFDTSKPDPNNPFFSFHKGKVEYIKRQSCLDDYSKIAFMDTEDILNGTCMEVTDYNGNVLGYYLYIKCVSGNCSKYDKYKTFN